MWLTQRRGVMAVTRIGVLGGTFDPIHVGHVELARTAADELNLNKVLLVPTWSQKFKNGSEVVSPEMRYHMCELAAVEDARFEACDVDIVRNKVTLTLDTLTDLRKRMPGSEFFFILGSDSLRSFPRWTDYERILELAHIVSAKRSGVVLSEAEMVDLDGFVHHWLNFKEHNVSSTEVRAALASGGSMSNILPPLVGRYITDMGLYL